MQVIISNELVDYPSALDFMKHKVEGIINNTQSECLWFLQHPPLYTAGTSAKASDLLSSQFPVYDAGRGGQYTYHGPGQLICYVMTKLEPKDVKIFVWRLEELIIQTLADYGIKGERREGRVGIWVANKKPSPLEGEGMGGGIEEKIAAIGIRLKKWVSFHGISINLNPNLSHFGGIIPCGLSQFGVTSFEKLAVDVDFNEIAERMAHKFHEVFSN